MGEKSPCPPAPRRKTPGQLQTEIAHKKIRYLEQKKDTNIKRYLDPKDLVSKDATSLY